MGGHRSGRDLSAEVERIAPALARLLTAKLVDALGGVDAVEAFGKAAIVGTAGEIEHGGALIHTPYFGNLMREFLDGESIICFADTRAEAGESAGRPALAQDPRRDPQSLSNDHHPHLRRAPGRRARDRRRRLHRPAATSPHRGPQDRSCSYRQESGECAVMKIRKIVTIVEEIRTEGGREVNPPARVAVVAAVIENPWAGQGFVEDLDPGIDATASDLGALLAPQVLDALGAHRRGLRQGRDRGPRRRDRTRFRTDPHAQVR